MDSQDFQKPASLSPPAGFAEQTRARDAADLALKKKIGFTPGHDKRVEQAEARTEQAEARTELAKTRTEQAETRTEEAETRTEQAKTRTEQAEIRTEQAETRSEQAIRASELSYRRLFEAAKDGILILESDTGRISDVNPFLMAMLGFSHDELVGRAIWELGPFKDIVANKARFEQLQSAGYAQSDNLPLETRDGRKLAVEFVTNVYQAGDKNVIQCNVRDITQRRRMEEQIRALNAELEQRVADRTAKLQAANEKLAAFSYSVSHDLRAPLRHIRGFTHLLERVAGPPLSGEQLGHLQAISKSTARMGKLIDDLLAFARIGQTELRKTDINLDQLMRETQADFREDCQGRDLVWDIQPLPPVRADPALLRLALVNLVSNAVKFTSAREHARIEIGCSSGNGDATVIHVRDNGVGFNPCYADKLFNPFQRLHSQEDFEGSGIGLANVRRIIEAHGGRTWAEGAVGAGATFYLSLPKEPGEACDQEHPHQAEPQPLVSEPASIR